jgi:hypothetical protein
MSTYHSIGDGLDSVAAGVEHVYDEATALVGDAADGVKSGVESVAGTLAGYLSMAASALTLK